MERKEVVKAEDELTDLACPVSLPNTAKIEPEVINLLSTSSDTQPSPHTKPNIFPIDELGGITPISRAADIPSRPPRQLRLEEANFSWDIMTYATKVRKRN